MKDWILGIDPGLSGAISCFKADHLNNLDLMGVTDMPIEPNLRGKGNTINLVALREIMESFSKLARIVYIELVCSRPGEAASAAFKFGGVAMAPEAMALAFGMQVKHVSPAVWKKAAGLTGKPKEASLALARREFPSIASELMRAKDEGRAEAILIGRYGHKLYGGNNG